jgi:hypothetical protein
MRSVRRTFFRSAARGLHVPAELTREATEREPRKRRANERHVVGCCEELAGSCHVRVIARAISLALRFDLDDHQFAGFNISDCGAKFFYNRKQSLKP